MGGLSDSRIRRGRCVRTPQKGNVAEDLSEEIKKHTGEETIVSDLTYELRSGSPDFIDKMIATTFASMAIDAILKGESGQMTGHLQRLLR